MNKINIEKKSLKEFNEYLKAIQIKECCVTGCNNPPEVEVFVHFHDHFLIGNEVDFGFHLLICKRCKGTFHKNMKSITDLPLV